VILNFGFRNPDFEIRNSNFMRKPLLFLSFLLSLIVVACAQEQEPGGAYPPYRVPDRIVLSWSEDPAHSMSVSWRTSINVKEAVAEFKIADASPYFNDASVVKARTAFFKSDKNAAHYHSVTFRDLEPNTLYAYRVGDNRVWSEWSHFRTAAEGEKPFSFIYFGDAQNDLKSRWSRTIRQAYSHMPQADFLLHAGDLINIPNADDEWGEWFYSGGWIYRTMPSISTPGNHEYLRNGEQGRQLTPHWAPTFTLPENGPEGLEESAYYIDYQGARIISFNSPDFLYYKERRSAQVEWIEKVLRENPQKWTIVTMHHPVYSPATERDNPDLREALKPLFDKYGVDIVLQGHDHTYARGGNNLPQGTTVLDSTGPVYVVSVSGPKMYPSSLGGWIDRAAMETQLYQLIHVEGNFLTFEAYTTIGELYDKFQLVKGPGGKNLFIDMTPENVPERLGNPPDSPSFRRMSPEELDAWKKRFKEYKARKSGKK
jgi:hypothetical protein